MSTDLCDRLRGRRTATKWARGLDLDYATAWEPDALCQEAAAEIDRLRAELDEAREKQRLLTDHAVRVDREAFRDNVDALSKLDLDALDVQPLLLAVQNWDISTGRARELLRCWVLGTFHGDMLPECGHDLFADTEEPREAWSRLRAVNAQLLAACRTAVFALKGREHDGFLRAAIAAATGEGA